MILPAIIVTEKKHDKNNTMQRTMTVSRSSNERNTEIKSVAF